MKLFFCSILRSINIFLAIAFVVFFLVACNKSNSQNQIENNQGSEVNSNAADVEEVFYTTDGVEATEIEYISDSESPTGWASAKLKVTDDFSFIASASSEIDIKDLIIRVGIAASNSNLDMVTDQYVSVQYPDTYESSRIIDIISSTGSKFVIVKRGYHNGVFKVNLLERADGSKYFIAPKLFGNEKRLIFTLGIE